MSRNQAFTDGFVAGLLGQKSRPGLTPAQKQSDAIHRKRMYAAMNRQQLASNAMPRIKMYISPWVRDPADGCMTRFARAVD